MHAWCSHVLVCNTVCINKRQSRKYILQTELQLTCNPSCLPYMWKYWRALNLAICLSTVQLHFGEFESPGFNG